jgi:hypothetical protein
VPKVKKHHYGWIIAAVIVVAVLAVPLEVFVQFVYETRQKAEITEGLLKTLTVFLSALMALIIHKVFKR